jgi:uncharacterized protein with GYD domain
MPKYMIQGTFTQHGTKGLIEDGGTKRREAVNVAISSVGGTLEAFYFAFGGDDVVILCDLPTNASAAALSLAAAATGAFKPKMTVLLTPEEMDTATKTTIDYRAPGQ